jgi:hypothetical protein
MKRRKKIIFLISAIFILLLASAISFVFNPLGLGPEPDIVLSRDFFDEPAKDLSELELLVDGEAAFGKCCPPSMPLKIRSIFRPISGKMIKSADTWSRNLKLRRIEGWW